MRFRPYKCLGLVLRPHSTEDTDNRYFPLQHVGRIAHTARVREGVPLHVGEVARRVRFEEARGREEEFPAVVPEGAPVAEVGAGDFAGPTSPCYEKCDVERLGREYGQFLAPLEVLVVVEEIIAALAIGAVVYSAVFAGFGGVELTERPGEGLRCEVIFVGW